MEPHGLVNATQLPWVSMADSVSYVIVKMLEISTIHVMLPNHLTPPFTFLNRNAIIDIQYLVAIRFSSPIRDKPTSVITITYLLLLLCL